MEKGVFVVIFASVDLVKCHGVAISGNLVCWLNVVGEWHSHKTIDNFIVRDRAWLQTVSAQGSVSPTEPSMTINDVTLVVLA